MLTADGDSPLNQNEKFLTQASRRQLESEIQRLRAENLIMRSVCRDVVRYWDEDCPQVSMNELADAARPFSENPKP